VSKKPKFIRTGKPCAIKCSYSVSKHLRNVAFELFALCFVLESTWVWITVNVTKGFSGFPRPVWRDAYARYLWFSSHIHHPTYRSTSLQTNHKIIQIYLREHQPGQKSSLSSKRQWWDTNETLNLCLCGNSVTSWIFSISLYILILCLRFNSRKTELFLWSNK
jgi:hypothetical protein